MSRYIRIDDLEQYSLSQVINGVVNIQKLKTADVVEVLHGEWIPIDVGDCCYRCSVCNFVRDAYLLEEDNYCPHCGAKMDL